MARDSPDITAEERRSFVQRRLDNPEDFLLTEEYNSFSKKDQQKIDESWVFGRFAQVFALGIDPLDHENLDPPFPDIRAVINKNPQDFELAEAADAGLAEITSNAGKSGAAAPFGSNTTTD